MVIFVTQVMSNSLYRKICGLQFSFMANSKQYRCSGLNEIIPETVNRAIDHYCFGQIGLILLHGERVEYGDFLLGKWKY